MATRRDRYLKSKRSVRYLRNYSHRLQFSPNDLVFLQHEMDHQQHLLSGRDSEVHQLKQQLIEKQLEVDALRDIGTALGSAIQVEDSLNALVEVTQHLIGTETCHILLFDESQTELVLRASEEESRHMVGKVRLKVGEGIIGWVARERVPVAVPHSAYQDKRFKFFPELNEGVYESMLAVPLVFDNEVLGVVSVKTKRPREYGPNQIRLLSSLAVQVAGTIQKTRNYRVLQHQAAQVNTFTEITKQVTSNLYLEDQLQFVVNMAAQAMNYKVCTVMLYDEKHDELVLKSSSITSQDYVSKPNLPVHNSVTGQALLEDRVVIVNDVSKEKNYVFGDIAAKEGFCSLMSVPIKSADRPLGVLNCYTSDFHNFSDEEIKIVTAFANQIALAVQQARLSLRSAILSEMHHRVKNNLQQVASLLRMQLRYTDVAQAQDALRESLSRISSIAAVHDLLSREDLDLVPVQRLAESILSATQGGLIPPNKHVETSITGLDFMLPLQKATSFALILNELIQNSVEHGFKDTDTGEIRVIIDDLGRDYRVTVINDGATLPEEFDFRKTPRLGLKIVDDLARSGLKGSFWMGNVDGYAHARVVFPKEETVPLDGKG